MRRHLNDIKEFALMCVTFGLVVVAAAMPGGKKGVDVLSSSK